MIPQIEPYISDDDIEWVHQYMQSGGWITEFEETKKFEKEIAKIVDVSHCTVCTSGTAGLILALLACGVERGNKVLIPNFTMFATLAAVQAIGAVPVLADVDLDTQCLDLDNVPESIDAVVYVSINGRSNSNIAQQIKTLQDKGIRVIEDACQSFGSIISGNNLGTMGDAGVYSFTPHKIITTGQGGAVVTNDGKIHENVQKLKDFGRSIPGVDVHQMYGYNFKFTDLQAALGRSQLVNINHRINRKREIYAKYSKRLHPMYGLGVEPFYRVPWFVDVIFKTRDRRDGAIIHLRNKGIGSRPFYPSLSTQPVCRHKYADSEFPNSLRLSECGLWLPSSLILKNYQIEEICDVVLDYSTKPCREFFKKLREEEADA